MSDRQINQVKFSERFGTWIGTSDGLFLKLPAQSSFTSVLAGHHIHHINFDGKNVLVSTNRGLLQFNDKGVYEKTIPLLSDVASALFSLRAANGELWVASSRVLVLSEDGKSILHQLSHDEKNRRTISEDRVRIIYETNDGTIWLGTFGYGLNNHKPQTRAITYLSEQSQIKLSSNYISSIYSPDDTIVFVGTSRGVNIINRAKETVQVFNPSAGNLRDPLFHVYAIKVGRKGDLWMAATGGMFLWNKMSFVPVIQSMGEILDFEELDSTSILLVTRTRGCYTLDKLTRKVTSFLGPELFSADLSTVRVDRDKIWLGAHDGLRCYDRNANLLDHFVVDPANAKAIPSNSVKGLFIDPLRNLWIGTWGGGLAKFNSSSKTFETLTTHDGLPNNVVYGLIEDDQGNLWMSTNNGLAALDPRKKIFRTFDVIDGLQSNEFNTGAYFKSINGLVYFGGINGLNIFRPEELLASGKLADVLLTKIEQGDGHVEPIGEGGAIHSSWQNDDLTLHFAAIDFSASHKYVFQYSMNGDPWRNLGNARRLDLPNLAAGSYMVRVRSSINGSVWTDGKALATIKVDGPLWQRPVAFVPFLLFLTFVIYLAYRLRLKRVNKLNESLNRIVADRTREVQQKNEEIVTQNEELLSQTDELTSKNIQLEHSKIELQNFQEQLEKRVNERTRDIQMLNRELLNQNVQLEQFSFITAHNFRGPVARIKGLADMLSNEPISKEDFTRIKAFLKTSIADLDNVINDLNAILHIKGKARDIYKPINLQRTIQRVLSELEPDIRLIGMRVDLGKFEDHELMGAEAFVHSIFYNLIENATKYAKTNVVPILSISCVRRDTNVLIEFADNGVGIDLNLAMAKIFRIYQRFTYGGQGRGLGLYLVKTQTEMMDGEIKVESTLGVGTTFTLIFPEIKKSRL